MLASGIRYLIAPQAEQRENRTRHPTIGPITAFSLVCNQTPKIELPKSTNVDKLSVTH